MEQLNVRTTTPSLRRVAHLEGLVIVDVERWLANRPEDSFLDADHGHLNFFVGIELLKLVLSMAAAGVARATQRLG